jgi:fumarate reductase flavoprotein subunit
MRYIVGLMMMLSALAGLVVTALLFPGCVSQKKGAETACEDALHEGTLYEGDLCESTLYQGSAMGYRGMIHVRVGFEQGTITEITVIESREDQAIGGAAIEELTDLVLMYNTTELDAVSGATETSKGFLEAIENAIMNL